MVLNKLEAFNATNPQMVDGFVKAMDEVHASLNIAILILTSAKKMFLS